MFYTNAKIADTPMYPKTKNTIKEIQVNTRCDCLDCKNPHVTKNDHKPFEKWKIT